MIIEGDCPGCKQPLGINTDTMKIKQTTKQIEHPEATTGNQTTVQVEKPEPEKIEIIKTVAPSDQPFFKCKNCNDSHENPNYSEKPNKKCKNCDSLNGDKTCKNCGNHDPDNFEELDNDELKDLGIPDPKEQSHDHESR